MRLLLDTHALLWYLTTPEKLPAAAHRAIRSAENEVYASLASAWEISIKVGLGKWPEARTLLDTFETAIEQEQFAILPITVAHVRAAGLMQSAHRDPFDRLLAAQAQIEGLTLVTADPKLAGLGAPVLW